MTANMNKKMESKRLLAAFVVIAMVVCAFVAAMPSTDAVDEEASVAPQLNIGSDVVPIDIASVDDISVDKLGNAYDDANKILVVPDTGMILNITEDVTVADLRIVLNGDLQITGDGKLSITATTAGSAYGAYTVTFNDDDAVLSISGADVTLDVNETKGSVLNNMYAYSDGSWSSPGCSGAVMVTNDATLNVNHTSGGSTWLGAPPTTAAWLLVENSTVNFTETKAIQEIVVEATNAELNFTDVLIGMSVMKGSSFVNSTVNVDGAEYNGLFIKGDITLSNSAFNIENTGTNQSNPRCGVMLLNSGSTTITMDGTSSIVSDYFNFTDGWDGYTDVANAVNFVGGTVSGEFQQAYSDADTVTTSQPAYSFDNTTVKDSSIAGKVTGSINAEKLTLTDTADVSSMKVLGGDLEISDISKMPSVKDGTVVDVTNKGVYSTYTFETNGYEIVIGIITATYTGDNIAGVNPVDAIVLKAVDLSNTNRTVNVDQANVTHLALDKIYASEEEAENNSTIYGDCTAAGGDYYVRMELSISIPDETSFSRLIIAPFTILPAEVSDIKIVGNEEDGSITPQPYTGSAIEPVPGVDFNVYINGSETPLSPDQYRVTYEDNTAVSENAKIIVTLIDNYTSDPETKTFEIFQDLKSITATPSKDSYYEGEALGTVNVTGTYQNNTSAGALTLYDPEADPAQTGFLYTIDTEYLYDEDGDGKVVVTVTYVGNTDIKATFEVEVINITMIEVSDISTSDSYQKEYEFGEALDTNGMKITVTYEDEKTAIFQNVTETGSNTDNGFQLTTTGTIVTGLALSTDFIFGYDVFENIVGNVDVGVDYFGAKTSFPVTVNGFMVTYMNGTEKYGIQIGNKGEIAAVFNFVETSDETFTGWMVGTTGAIYQPGDVYTFGEDSKMWASDSITFFAQFGDGSGSQEPTGPTEASENILVSVVSTSTGVDVYLVALDGGYIPVDSVSLTVKVSYINQSGSAMLIDMPVEPKTVENTDNLSIIVVSFDLQTPAGELFDSIYSVGATFAGEPSMTILY